MRWVRRADAQGSATAEYLAVAVIVCALIVALISSGLPAGLGNAIVTAYKQAVCRVVDTSCPGVNGEESKAEQTGSEHGEDGGEHEDSGGNPVVDFFKGFGDGAADAVGGGVDAVSDLTSDIGGALKSAGKTGWHAIKGIGLGAWNDVLSIKDVFVHPVQTFNGIKNLIVHSTQQSLEKFHKRWQRGDHIGAIVGLAADYYAVQGSLVASLVIDQQVINDWKNGDKAQAVGRVIWNVGSFFIPGAGWALRAGKGIKAASVASKAAKAAEAASKAGKVEKAAAAAGKAEKAARKAEKAAKENPTKANRKAAQKARERADKAHAAAKSVRVNKGIDDALKSTDTNKKLEGTAADAVRKHVVDFNRHVPGTKTVRPGEIDVETKKTIIEVTTMPRGKLKQLPKYKSGAYNPDGKAVILYAPNYRRQPAEAAERAGFHVVRTPAQLRELLRQLGEG